MTLLLVELLDSLDDKEIKKLYSRLVDSEAEGVEVSKMRDDLEKFKGVMTDDELPTTIQERHSTA